MTFEKLPTEVIKVLISEREKQKRNGKFMWFAIIIFGVLGSQILGWTFVLFLLIVALIVGYLFGYRTGKKIERLTGLNLNDQIAAWSYIQKKELEKHKFVNKPPSGHNILGKITGIEQKVKWSRGKKIQVFGPPIYGYHNIFVDINFKVAIFLPKADKTLHILIGDIFNANRWLKFDASGNKIFHKILSESAHEWKINPKTILYRGDMFSPEQQIYKGKVVEFSEFNERITDEWLHAMKDQFIDFMLKS